MKQCLWIDDIRPCPEDDEYHTWWTAEDYEEATLLMSQHTYHLVSLDFDLGYGPSGLEVLRWMDKNLAKWPLIRIHSQNPIGVSRMFLELRDIETRRAAAT